MTEATPGRLIARGRAADVFELGADRVLRLYREGEGGDVAVEAAAMEHARLHGFPVPAVPDASDRDIVLDRVDGPTGNGPVVIDWSGASRGEAADDVAQTWVIMATSVVPGPLAFRVLARAGRRLLLDAFLSAVDAEGARRRLPEVARRRLERDPHLLAPERAALAALVG